jgi:hypothetical protein
MEPHSVYDTSNEFEAADKFQEDADRNVFIMMRYGDGDKYRDIDLALKKALSRFGFHGILARDQTFHEQLWNHITFCMSHSRYGIAVFEQNPKTSEFNPNVSVELGFMLAQKKRCLILKEHELPKLQADLVGHLYVEFRQGSIEHDLDVAVTRWLGALGHAPTTEEITASTPVDAKKARTRRIVESLKLVEPGASAIIRQAASLSSLAISPKETLLESDDNKGLKSLLLDERQTLIHLIERGVIVRFIIAPDVYRVAVEANLITADVVNGDVLKRVDQLIATLESHVTTSNLQIVYVTRLPHENLLIVGSEVFLGRRRLKEWGFPRTTVAREPTLVASEVAQFDLLFDDAVKSLLGDEHATPHDYGNRGLKLTVIKHLKECRRDLEARVSRGKETKGGRITPVHKNKNKNRFKIPWDVFKGRMEMTEDFDAPLDVFKDYL